jgi:YD repeat-containing protein
MRKYNLLIIVLMVLKFNNTFSQGKNYAPQIFQGNPEVSQIQKYKETPVSLNTGVPNISVPIYTINFDGISIPIELNYHSTGFRVNEIASSVGLGWSLSANSVISRVVKGKPDDSSFGYINTSLKAESVTQQEITAGIGSNNLDLEPDSFSINLPTGKSIDFMFKQNLANNKQNIICFPKSQVKINVSYNNFSIASFEVIDTDGTRYYFGEDDNVDRATSKNYEFDPETGSLPAEILLSSSSGINTWHLTRIVSTKSNVITYNYRMEVYHVSENCEHSNQTISFEYVPNMYLQSNRSYTLSGRLGSNKVLESILTPKETIEFIAGDKRDDLVFNKKTIGVNIFDINNRKINAVIFQQSYFMSPDTYLYMGYGCGTNFKYEQLSKRLSLDAVIFKGRSDNISEYFSYQFEYNTDVILPHRNSFAQDYWGYYNGENDNQDLIPSVFFNTKKELFNEEEEDNYTLRIENNNSIRTINPYYTQACMLKKIIYPEKGYTELEYENNKIPAEDNIDKYIMDSNDKISVELTTSEVASTLQHIGNYDYYVFSKDFTLDSQFINEYGIFYDSHSSICEPVDAEGMQNIDCSRFNIVKNSTGENVLPFNKSVGVQGSIFKDGYYTPGTYTLKLYILKDDWDNAPADKHIWLKLNWLKRILDSERYFGGLRIKSIKNYNHSGSLITEKQFDYRADNGLSSGKYLNFPIFKNVKYANYRYYTNVVCHIHGGGVLFGQMIGGYKISFSSNSYAPLLNRGNYLLYSIVKEISVDYTNNNNLLTENEFSFFAPTFNYISEPISRLWENGNIVAKHSVNEDQSYLYNINKIDYTLGLDVNNLNYPCNLNLNLIPHCIDNRLPRFQFDSEFTNSPFLPRYYLYTNNFYTKKITTVKDNVTNVVESFYNSLTNLGLSSQVTHNSTNDKLETKYFYPNDPEMESEPFSSELVANNIIGAPLVTQYFKSDNQLSEEKTEYKRDTSTNNLLLPKYIYTKKGSVGEPEKRFTYNQYDNKGNLLHYTLENGTPVSIIWGYNKTQPVAKLENISYASIPASLITAIQNATDSATSTEAQVLTALNALRTSTDANMQKSMITTYTYKPLIGVSTITDPKGDTQTYIYDEFNRLKEVRDKDNNILSENQYHYRTPN